jgi:uroporphyrinogen-III synthase
MNQEGQIWVTRSLNERQRSYAINLGLRIKEIALTKIQHLKFPKELPDSEAWIFTSQNAVKNLTKMNFTGTIYASGKQTANALKEKGFDSKSGPTETALSLAETIALDGVPNHLAKKNIQLKEEVLYHTLLEPKMIPTKKGDVLFFMSPSAVESFAMTNPFSSDVNYYSIGETTAHALRKKGVQKINTAAEASFEAMLKQYTTENK